jgi:hypothetical protein
LSGTNGFVQADAAGKRNANIGMAHKASKNADGAPCSINFGHERSRSFGDVVFV